MDNPAVRLELGCSIENLAILSESIENIADEYGASASDVMKLQLAAEEIFSNVVFYAHESGEGNSVDIELSFRDGSIEIEFRDRGEEFNPLNADKPDLDLPLEQREIGGLGIFLVRETMDKAEYVRSGGENILRIGKKIR
jgi:anti-sigma regulatory factor (Ser/Thr protein kinase)